MEISALSDNEYIAMYKDRSQKKNTLKVLRHGRMSHFLCAQTSLKVVYFTRAPPYFTASSTSQKHVPTVLLALFCDALVFL